MSHSWCNLYPVMSIDGEIHNTCYLKLSTADRWNTWLLFFFFLIYELFRVNYYLMSKFCSYFFKDGEIIFFRTYFSFSDKVFCPVTNIMNGLQHLIIPTSLKYYVNIHLTPTPQNLASAVLRLAPTFFIWQKRWQPLFLEPQQTLMNFYQNEHLNDMF